MGGQTGGRRNRDFRIYTKSSGNRRRRPKTRNGTDQDVLFPSIGLIIRFVVYSDGRVNGSAINPSTAFPPRKWPREYTRRAGAGSSSRVFDGHVFCDHQTVYASVTGQGDDQSRAEDVVQRKEFAGQHSERHEVSAKRMPLIGK